MTGRAGFQRKTVWAACVLLCGAVPVLAAGARGTSAYQFLQLGVGARPSAMGGAFAGVGGGVSAVYWNPAGLAGLERCELSMTHALWLEDITYTNLAAGVPALGGTVGVAFNLLATRGIQQADNTGTRLAESYDMVDSMQLVSYARRWGDLSLGVNLKHISSRIENEDSTSYAADLGALYGGLKPMGRTLTLGVAAQNLGTEAKYVEEAAPLPVILRAGAAMDLFKGLLVSADAVYKEEEVRLHAGAEFTTGLGSVDVALRAGYNDESAGALGALSGLTLGMGIRWGDYQLDYAWKSFAELGMTHGITLGIKFGGRL